MAPTAARERPMPVKLRPGTPADYRAVKKLLTANQLPVDGVPASLLNFLVAEDGKKIVGAIGLEVFGKVALLRSAVVAESARGAELGAKLVDGMLSKTRVIGVSEVYLLTTTAEKYFPRFGFAAVLRDSAPQELSASAELTGACPASAVLMKWDPRTPRRD